MNAIKFTAAEASELIKNAKEPIFQDSYGRGYANYGNKSFATKSDLLDHLRAEKLNKVLTEYRLK